VETGSDKAQRSGSYAYHAGAQVSRHPSTLERTGSLIIKTTEYQKDLIKALKDPAEAAAYLNAALEEGDRKTILLAQRNVAEANCEMAAAAEKESA